MYIQFMSGIFKRLRLDQMILKMLFNLKFSSSRAASSSVHCAFYLKILVLTLKQNRAFF